jgi:hypothetical protein
MGGCISGLWLVVACNAAHTPTVLDAGEGNPVGAPCVPYDEQWPELPGLGVEETNINTESSQCASRICLANHFQGRVSCPYGQTQADIDTLPADSPQRCRLTTQAGVVSSGAVAVPVAPQLVARQAADVVICSCRCAGNDATARYCTCPAGLTCSLLFPDLGIGSEQLAGSYCMKAGTEYDRASLGSATECTASSSDPATDCGNGRQNP